MAEAAERMSRRSSRSASTNPGGELDIRRLLKVLQSLREGAFVRASADLYARGNPVTEIQVLPSARE